MEYLCIERPADAFQQSVALGHIVAMCQRAFGEHVHILSIKELAGGLYNSTFLIALDSTEQVVLRVAPQSKDMSETVAMVMRNEVAVQPFLAPIASFLPRIIMTDFTHQIIARDYMFQSFVEGDQWEQVRESMTVEENTILWRQLGTILKHIHSVHGRSFGSPYPAPAISCWSILVVNWLESTIRDVELAQLDASDLEIVLAIAYQHADILDEIKVPSLLHGDLWTVNVLVKRDERPSIPPTITAILDADRASWGDPMSDWTIFLMRYHPRYAKAFWETYAGTGHAPEMDRAARLRLEIYHACHIGSARLEQAREHNQEKVQFSYQDMQTVLSALNKLSM